MHRFLALTPVSPIRIGGVKVGAYLDTLDYIPGSVIRGAVAEWLIQNGRESEIPEIVNRIRFGNFFPTYSKNYISLPFPSTAVECKVKSGFINVPRKDQKEKGHGIRDILLITLDYLELEKLGARFPVPMLLRCKECKGRLEKLSGFYVKLQEGYRKVKISKIVQTKVALSRHRRASQERMLYHVVGIKPKDITFIGRIWTDNDEDLKLIKEAIENIGIGSLTTRGFGNVKVEEVNPKLQLPSLEDRLNKFNERLKEVWSQLFSLIKQSNIPKEPDYTYFSIDLLSPAILSSNQSIPTLKLNLGGDFELIYWFTQPTFIGGWSTAWGLYKPTSLAAASGSVYVFKTEKSIEEILPKLEELENKGVGYRTDEGYGEILICHPFHLEVRPV